MFIHLCVREQCIEVSSTLEDSLMPLFNRTAPTGNPYFDFYELRLDGSDFRRLCVVTECVLWCQTFFPQPVCEGQPYC